VTGNHLLAAFGAILLFIGFRWGHLAIHNVTVSRTDNPVGFWLAMALAFVGMAVGLLLAATGN
jgi:dipeptide/tripeptide permease